MHIIFLITFSNFIRKKRFLIKIFNKIHVTSLIEQEELENIDSFFKLLLYFFNHIISNGFSCISLHLSVHRILSFRIWKSQFLKKMDRRMDRCWGKREDKWIPNRIRDREDTEGWTSRSCGSQRTGWKFNFHEQGEKD